MHLSTFKSLNKKFLCGGILFIIISLFLTSCNNFLKADEIKNEIEKVIDYNNAQLVNVLFHSEERIGSFLVEGEKEFKINHTVAEVQYTTNKKVCIFYGLEAVSRNDTNINRNDCVKISEISANKDTGVYTYSVKVTKKQNDILIRPVYQLRPSIVSISPLYTNDPTEPIVITFDTPMEAIDIQSENSVFDFSNISIKCDNMDISDKFNTPVFNEDKTVLTITPNSAEFNSYLRNKISLTYTDIYISFDSRTIFKIDENFLRFAEDSSLDFTLHYCTNFEINPPLQREFKVYKKWNTTTNIGSDRFYLNYDDFLTDSECWDDENEDIYIEDEDFADSITGEYVYIYGKYYDADSDVKTILVEEYYDRKLNEDGAITSLIKKEYTKDSDEVILWKRYPDDSIAFCIKKKLLSEDGIISIRTTVKDTYGNSAPQQEIAVIKSTSIDLIDAKLINVPLTEFLHDDDPIPFDMDEYEYNLRDIKLIYIDPKADTDEINWSLIGEEDDFRPTYGYRYINPDAAYESIQCQYYNDDNVLITADLEPEDLTGIYSGATKWHYYIDEDDVADLNNLTVRIILEDYIGNTYYKDFSFPGKTILASDEIINSSKRRLMQFPENKNTDRSCLIVFKNNNTLKAAYYSYNTIDLDISYIPDGTVFYLLSCDTAMLCSQLNDRFIAGTTQPDTHSIEYDNIYYENTEDEKTLINIKIKDSSINYFDTIFIKIGPRKNRLDNLNTLFLSKNEKNIKTEIQTQFLYEYDYQLILFGIKDGVCTSSETIIIDKFTDPKYDNVRPKLVYSDTHMRFPDCYCFTPEDRQSGISRIYFNDRLVELPVMSDDNTYAYMLNLNNDKISIQPINITDWYEGGVIDGAIVVNLNEIIDYSPGVPWIKFEIKVYDKANNVYTKKINEIIQQRNPLEVKNKNNNNWTFSSKDGTFGFNVSYFFNKQWTYYYCKASMDSFTEQQVPYNYFLRFLNKNSIPKYYYGTTNYNSGTQTHNKSNDSLAYIGSSSQLQISSNDPVLVQTIISPCSYSICKDWTKDEWLFYTKIIGEEVFKFKPSNNYTSAYYTIPLDEIKSNECYVVVAHFADGSSIMSEVMVKE